MFRKIFSLSALCVSALFALAGNASAAEVTNVCIGEIEHNCPASHNAFYSCGSDAHKIAKEICTVFTTEGVGAPARYRLIHYDSKGGNSCGYEFYKITCVD
jgi:hypothetical protein